MEYPHPMQVVAQVAHEASGSDLQEQRRFYAIVLSTVADWSGSFEPTKGRYAWTPVELMPISHYGVNCAHDGLVIHAPELELHDYLVGSFCAIEYNGVQFAGRDSRHFIEMRLSACLKIWQDATLDAGATDRARIKLEREKYLPYLEQIAKELQLKPRASMKVFGWGKQENEVDLRKPDIPKGWQYAATEDNIGVLAPKALFDPTYPVYVDDDGFRAARVLKRRGFYASALYVMKQFGWQNRFDDPKCEILEETLSLYEKLERPMHVDAAKAQIKLNKEVKRMKNL